MLPDLLPNPPPREPQDPIQTYRVDTIAPQYTLVEATYAADLIRLVNEKMKGGWRLGGNILVAKDSFFQPMILG